MNCFTVFDHFVGLALKGLILFVHIGHANFDFDQYLLNIVFNFFSFLALMLFLALKKVKMIKIIPCQIPTT